MKIKAFKLREQIFKFVFLLNDILLQAKEILYSFSLFAFTLTAIIFISLFVFDIGFNIHQETTNTSFLYLLTSLFICKLLLEITHLNIKNWKFLTGKILILLFVLYILLVKHNYIYPQNLLVDEFLLSNRNLVLVSFVLIFTESYHLSDTFNKLNLSPSVLFAGSFLIIIFIGSGFLMMPKATITPISYFDALFTSVSAVCVTGLVVVDTSASFTPLGKGIILILIQIGGLGIMAFTGFFSYIFSGAASIKERLLLKDVFSGENLGGMFKLLAKIILLTIIIEFIGTVLIYHSLEGNWNDKLTISIFHSISAFCNAGFSIFPEGMANQSIHFNSYLQLTISFLIILGGIGFPVLLYFYGLIKNKGTNITIKILKIKKPAILSPLAIGQKIAVKTTIFLLVIGTIFYYYFEKDNTLAGLGHYQQLIASFFGSTSARTAGFNIIDISHWGYITIYLMIFLMWVGASPGSTGGGIKTTTFALAFKVVMNYCRGRKHVEIENREIGTQTIMKVLSVIFISIFVIIISSALLMIFEPGVRPESLIFECVSAFSTVGLSVANTPTLTENSKIVLILLMYIGRIGPILLLTQLIPSKGNDFYRLPVENIAIN